MSFENILRSMLDRVEGARAAVLMGLDGIAVAEEKAGDSGVSLADASVELGRSLADAAKAAAANEWGEMGEMVIVTERHRFLFRLLNDQYFVGLLLDSDGNLGKGRFVLRQASPLIRAEL